MTTTETPQVWALVGCPGSLVCVDKFVCVAVVSRLAALRGEGKGDAARDKTRADAQVCVRESSLTRSRVLHSASHSVACEQSLVRCWTTFLLLKQ